ncbi:transposase [Cognaticolwellia beringensis]|uniref:Transposase n=1 Tax=Cognaticolwellia beringensis TaxID=1967665 RepID=A0A222GD06_9GAMM|nr:transposase [Cognaticolwellia beringensis]ASP49747.1 transposase [Cognaticolwellia beringensis]
MTTARKQLISLVDTPYYHCISRCVRRAYLCGEDKLTGKSFEHRRSWVEDKLITLSQVFAIDICAYAIMSNHTHLVLFIDEASAKAWSSEEVLKRWHQIFKGTLLTQQYCRGESIADYLQPTLNDTVECYRSRLMDISWFMRLLNESVARKANQEDNCTGRFWEGRFKSQALLDESALAACMAYVDLNPVRAGVANTPESSAYTSVKTRVIQAKMGKQPTYLLPFVGNPKNHMPKGLPFVLIDYLELVDLTGRSMREDKPGYITHKHPELLQRLNIGSENWLTLTKDFRKLFHGAVGHTAALTAYYQHHEAKRRQNLKCCEKLLA